MTKGLAWVQEIFRNEHAFAHILIDECLERNQNIAPNETTRLHSELSQWIHLQMQALNSQTFLIKGLEKDLPMSTDN